MSIWSRIRWFHMNIVSTWSTRHQMTGCSKNAAAESSKQYTSSLSICQMCSAVGNWTRLCGWDREGSARSTSTTIDEVGGSTNYRRFPKNQSCAQCMANKSSNIGKYRNNKLFISNVFIWLFHFRRFKN